ncbi:MAG: PQQ-dependent sugar dehydrogenase [Anaerolineae bacterium]|nr:PQQ-dependent sugar dehydrogenase [Anaerolineae bacterium]
MSNSTLIHLLVLAWNSSLLDLMALSRATWGPDDTDRFFVVSRTGVIHIMADAVLQEPPFLDISQQVASEGTEQGLLSVAFHPDFAQNNTFYVYYTQQLNNDATLVRYQTLPNNHDIADLNSALPLLTIPQIDTHHNGGTLLFGPDGYLYLSVGNGGDKNMNAQATAQDLSNYLGTILRLDVSDLNVPYQIPPDNPFLNVPGALPEIWAYGLRNPWRMAFDAQTGDLYIADVGESTREEVNFQPAGHGAGANYGWPWFEGSATTAAEDVDAINRDDFVFPITDYDHLALGGCSVIGGDVYYGQALPELTGKFLFGDFCSGFVWALEVAEDGQGKVKTLLRDPAIRQSAFATDGDGEMYLLDVATGNMYKLVGNR